MNPGLKKLRALQQSLPKGDALSSFEKARKASTTPQLEEILMVENSEIGAHLERKALVRKACESIAALWSWPGNESIAIWDWIKAQPMLWEAIQHSEESLNESCRCNSDLHTVRKRCIDWYRSWKEAIDAAHRLQSERDNHSLLV